MERGISIRDLERRASINRATISMIERGVMVATPAQADLLALALGLAAGDLVSRTMLVHEAA